MNNYIPDQEVVNATKRMISVPGNFFRSFDFEVRKGYKSERDELFNRLLVGWNIQRVRAGYKKISPARLASAINSNPFLKSDDGALRTLVFECEKVGNYKKAHWTLYPKKTK